VYIIIGCTHVSVAEKLLDCADVVTILEEERAEGVAKDMRAGGLRETCRLGGVPHGPLEDRLVEVMTAALTGVGRDVKARGGKDPLPCQLPGSPWILDPQRMGQLDAAGTFAEVHLTDSGK